MNQESPSPCNKEWLKELHSTVDGLVTSIVKVWETIGVKGERLAMRQKSTIEHVRTLLGDMLEEEQTAQATIENLVRKMKLEIDEMSAGLSLPPYVLPEGLNLVELEKALYEAHKVLDEQRQERVSALSRAQTEETALCARLGEKPVALVAGMVPTPQQIASVQRHVDTMNQEKRHRLVEFIKLQSQINYELSQLELSASDVSPLCTTVMARNAPDTTPLTRDHLDTVEVLAQELVHKAEAMRSECGELVERIKTLWDRLEVPLGERRDLVQTYSPRVLEELRSDVVRLEELRRANLGRLIEVCRTELVQIWDRCLVSDSERGAFYPMQETEESEELLALHENEIDRWRHHYSSNEKLFNVIEQWNLLFAQLKDTERKLKDPCILQNRGGILLRVEKEHKRLNRELPQLEMKMKELLSGADPLPMLDGLPIAEYMGRAWQQLADEKENEKRTRQEKATRLKAEEVRYGSKPVTPLAKKRAMNATHRFDPHNITAAKVRKLNDSHAVLPKMSTPRRLPPAPVWGSNTPKISSNKAVAGPKVFRSPKAPPSKAGTRTPQPVSQKAAPSRGGLRRRSKSVPSLAIIPAGRSKAKTKTGLSSLNETVSTSSDKTASSIAYSEFALGLTDGKRQCSSSVGDSGVGSAHTPRRTKR